MKEVLGATQALGRALMLPIAVLPIAALLLRLGQPDLLGFAPIAAAGEAIFSNLGLLFAIGVAVGLARENHGAAGLAAAVCFLVATQGASALLPVPAAALSGLTGNAATLAAADYRTHQLAKLSVPVGLLSGIIAGIAYNRFNSIRLPSYLAFFAGRRFVPIATGFAGLLLAAAFGLGWPFLERGMDALSHAVLAAGPAGLFIYGVLNRVLIVTGLHHILNNIAWFLLGDFHGVTGDLKRFFAGDPTAGAFMSGFFPVMMFGLPGACLAMYRAALPERRRGVAGLLLSMALTSFLTGVTEPIEFTFMFLAPLLYGVHAILTGAAMVIMDFAHVHLGFGFSAGLFDYVLNYSKATRPLALLPVGLIYFLLYYGLFRACIQRFDLKTPGREAGAAAASEPAVSAGDGARGGAFVAAFGGAANLRSIDACITRLRIVVADESLVDRAALSRLGSRGTVRVGPNALQVVMGPVADAIASEMRTATNIQRVPAPESETRDSGGVTTQPAAEPERVLRALGGRGNVLALDAGAGRLLVRLAHATDLDEGSLRASGARGVARLDGGIVHVIFGEGAGGLAQLLKPLLLPR